MVDIDAIARGPLVDNRRAHGHYRRMAHRRLRACACVVAAWLTAGCEIASTPGSGPSITGSVGLKLPNQEYHPVRDASQVVVHHDGRYKLVADDGSVLSAVAAPGLTIGDVWDAVRDPQTGDVWLGFKGAVSRLHPSMPEGIHCPIELDKEGLAQIHPLQRGRGSAAWIKGMSIGAGEQILLDMAGSVCRSKRFGSGQAAVEVTQEGDLFAVFMNGGQLRLRAFPSQVDGDVRDVTLFDSRDAPAATQAALQDEFRWSLHNVALRWSPDRQALWVRVDEHLFRVAGLPDEPVVSATTLRGMRGLAAVASDGAVLVATRERIQRVESGATVSVPEWMATIQPRTDHDRSSDFLWPIDDSLFYLSWTKEGYGAGREFITVMDRGGNSSAPIAAEHSFFRPVRLPVPGLIEDKLSGSCVLFEFADLRAPTQRKVDCRGESSSGEFIAVAETKADGSDVLEIQERVGGAERMVLPPVTRNTTLRVHDDAKGVWMSNCPATDACCERAGGRDTSLVRDVEGLGVELGVQFGAETRVITGDSPVEIRIAEPIGKFVEWHLSRPLGTSMVGLEYSLTLRDADGVVLGHELSHLASGQAFPLDAAVFDAGPVTLEAGARDRFGTDVRVRRSDVVFVRPFDVRWFVTSAEGRAVLFILGLIASFGLAFMVRRMAPRIGPWLPSVVVILCVFGFGGWSVAAGRPVVSLPLAIGVPVAAFGSLLLMGRWSPRVQRRLQFVEPFALATLWSLRSARYRERWYAPFLARQRAARGSDGMIPLHKPQGVDTLLEERFVAMPASLTWYPARDTEARGGDDSPVEACVAHLRSAPGARSRVVLIEGAGGLGKSALLRELLRRLASRTDAGSSGEGQVVVPVYCGGSGEGGVEGELLRVLGDGASERIIRPGLARGEILPVYDDVLGKGLAPELFTTYLAREGGRTLLLSTRPHKLLREALARSAELLHVRPLPLDDPRLPGFVERYTVASERALRVEAIRASLRGNDDLFLPIVVRLSTILPYKADLRLIDVYGDVFRMLTQGMVMPQTGEHASESPVAALERICMHDVWGKRLDGLDYEAKVAQPDPRDMQVLDELTACGLLHEDGPRIGRHATLRKFFHDSARSYMVACGLRHGRRPDATAGEAPTGDPDWDRIEEAAGDPHHRTSEIFEMAIALVDAKTAAKELLRRLDVGMLEVGDALGPRDVWQAVPRMYREGRTQFDPDMSPRAALAEALTLLPASGTGTGSPSAAFVAALAGLFHGLAGRIHDARGRALRDDEGVEGTPRSALARPLRTLFDADGLRRFVRELPAGEQLADELPTGNPTMFTLADEVARVIVQHGLVSDTLDLLTERAPKRREWFARIRARHAPP